MIFVAHQPAHSSASVIATERPGGSCTLNSRALGFTFKLPVSSRFSMPTYSQCNCNSDKDDSRTCGHLSFGSVAIGADTNHASTPGLGLHIQSSAPCNFLATSCGDQEVISANAYLVSSYARRKVVIRVSARLSRTANAPGFYVTLIRRTSRFIS